MRTIWSSCVAAWKGRKQRWPGLQSCWGTRFDPASPEDTIADLSEPGDGFDLSDITLNGDDVRTDCTAGLAVKA